MASKRCALANMHCVGHYDLGFGTGLCETMREPHMVRLQCMRATTESIAWCLVRKWKPDLDIRDRED